MFACVISIVLDIDSDKNLVTAKLSRIKIISFGY